MTAPVSFGDSKLKFILLLIYKIIEAPIFKAIESKNESEIDRLIEQPHTIFVKDKWGRTPLIAASAANMPNVVSKLIEKGADVDCIAKKSGTNAMCAASMIGATEVARALIEAGANIDQDTTDPDKLYEKMTPLMWAANRGFADFVQLLLDSGADINRANGRNTTALMYSASGNNQNIEIFKILIQHVPDIEIRDWRGRTVIDEARDRYKNSNRPDMKNLIEQYYKDIKI